MPAVRDGDRVVIIDQRIVAIDAGDTIFLLPRDQDIDKLQLKRSPRAMSLTDGKLAMDLSDFLLRP